MRKLAAIMFSDMTGYTALMQQNEQLAIAKRRRLKEVLETSVAAFHGQILQYYGDGALSIFNSAVDGVNCSVEIQRELRQESDAGPKVELRIGIHTGDISIEEEVIYGDGVNIASRIESLAVPGSVFISEKVFDEIKNQKNVPAREIGYFELKNVINPVRIFAIDNPHLVVPKRDSLTGKTSVPHNRLAVLPFVNMSADPENEYFSDGITEELLNALTKVEGLQVISRTSAFAFKGKNADIREIGIQLNVDKILEGSVRKSGNRVRITTQLINTADGYHIWSENYDRDLTDIFEVQDEISGIIANKLRENLSSSKHTKALVKTAAPGIEAYTLFLKGLHFYNKVTPDDSKKAIEYFNEAIKIEPGYANAYAMAAEAYASLGLTGQIHPDEAFKAVHKFADKSIELDSSCTAGLVAKGWAYLIYDWKWTEAYQSLQKAIELQPTASAYELLSFYYLSIGKKNEAVETMEKALNLDPISPIINQSLADAYLNAGRVDEALKRAELMLEMYPRMRAAVELTGWCMGMKGDWKKAVEIFEEVHRMVNHPLKAVTPLAYAYAQLGEEEKAREYVSKIKQRQIEEPRVVLDADLAIIHWALGEKDKAFEYLNNCVEKRLSPVVILVDHPFFKDMPNDPRYKLLKEKLKTEGYSKLVN